MNTMSEVGSVGGIVHTAAILRPDAAAILAPGHPVLRAGTLSTLLRNVERDLREIGVGQQHAVGIALPNGAEMATSFLAVSSCAVSAPLDSRLSEQDHMSYLTELGVKAVIVGEGMAAVEAATHAAGISLIRLVPQPEYGAGWFRLSVVRSGNTVGNILPDGTALVLPTSGTTARPKLVPLSHRNLVASARNIQNALALTESDRCLNVMPLVHIHGLIASVLSSITAGGAVVCPQGFSAREFLSWLNQFQPTWYTATPTIHQAVLQSMAGARQSINTTLRLIRSCSAALPPRVMGELESLFEVPVIEAYGMTEAAHQMASNPLPPAARKPGSVGLPTGTSIALMDGQGKLLKEGIGEIVIRGENVFNGYLGHKALNENVFRDGWFRTGDEGEFDADGYLRVTGRIKELINRGGEKITPREIEEVLLEYPGVAQAVSFAVPHLTFGEDVAAAVVAKEGISLVPRELRNFAASRLPAFKVPRSIHVVADIPKGRTGKLQRIGMAERLGIRASDEEPTLEEQGSLQADLEHRLALIWQEALKVDRVGGADDFFALGGDSLSAEEMLVRVSVEEDVELPQVSLYEYPTLRAFSKIVENALKERASLAGKTRGLVPIRVGGRRPPLFVATGHLGRFGQFCRLARHLGPDQPVFGFPPPVLGADRNHYRIETLASSFVELIRAVQPHGPYFLMGHCIGGFIVYETARQLEDAGEQIAFLGLIDTHRSITGERAVTRAHDLEWSSFFHRVAVHWRKMSEHRPSQLIPYAMERWGGIMQRLRKTTKWKCYRFLVSHGLPVWTSLLDPDFARAYALDHYNPGTVRSGALLVCTIGYRSEDLLMGWQGSFGGKVDTIRVVPEAWTEQGVELFSPEVARRLA